MRAPLSWPRRDGAPCAVLHFLRRQVEDNGLHAQDSKEVPRARSFDWSRSVESVHNVCASGLGRTGPDLTDEIARYLFKLSTLRVSKRTQKRTRTQAYTEHPSIPSGVRFASHHRYGSPMQQRGLNPPLVRDAANLHFATRVCDDDGSLHSVSTAT